MPFPPPGRWAELAILAASRAAMGAQFQVVGALGPLLIGTLAADWTQLGTLIGAYSMAGILVALPAGWVMARFGDRVVLLGGVVLMAGGGVALVALPLLGADWRAGLWLSAGVCAVSFLPLLWWLPRGVGPGAAPARRGGLLRGEWAPLLSAGTIWGFYDAAFVVALAAVPLHLRLAARTAP